MRQQEKLEIYYGPGRHFHTGNTVYFYISGLYTSFTYWKYTVEASNIEANEDIMENNYMFVTLSNLSVFSHLLFPLRVFLFLAKNLTRGPRWPWIAHLIF